MFDWQASEGDSQGNGSSHSVMSSRFWIYWVITLPLTAAVLVGWRFWWKYQRRSYAGGLLPPGEGERLAGKSEGGTAPGLTSGESTFGSRTS